MPRKLGMIVRADNGGLGAQTWEAYRHLRPDRVLVVNMLGRSRGLWDPRRYTDNVWSVTDQVPLDDRLIQRFVNGLETLFTCESFYSPRFASVARERGVEAVVQANPELYDLAGFQGATVVLPTSWLADGYAHDRILPVPVARDRLPPRHRTEARVFYHPAAPAMLDRNGTKAVLAALPHVKSNVTVVVRGGDPLPSGQHGNVRLEWLPWTDDPYWTAYPPGADVLLLPRRYGGLALPMQEAASLGMPAVLTAAAPSEDYGTLAMVVEAERTERFPMKGGTMPIHHPHPRHLATVIDELAGNPHLVRELSVGALDWAHEHRWAALLPEYEALLR